MALVSASALAALSTGCIVDIDDEPRPAVGDMTVVWTINGREDPAACDYYALDPAVGMDFELRVFDQARVNVTTEYAPCKAFRITVPLWDGLYDAEDVRVYYDTAVVIDIDFPASSFLFP
jgi:hypothetical protein